MWALILLATISVGGAISIALAYHRPAIMT